ncbi:MAG: hypothetical protein H6937_09485 [Burkholderiales bacterium]|nr:hypothetical protein [Burkholderiales bacterium]
MRIDIPAVSKVGYPKVDTISLKGGVDTETSPVLARPGTLISAMNWEPGINDGVANGYRRMGGIERYDGQPRPSDASYWMMEVNETGLYNVGDTVTGDVSGETGIIVDIERTPIVTSVYGFFDILGMSGVSMSGKYPNLVFLVLAKVSGTFTDNEDINVSGNSQGFFVDINENAATTSVLHARYKNLAADIIRNDISLPPGSGPARGVWYYNGDKYCFRDNVGATESLMYKATASGWSQITFGRELQFDGATGEIFEGDLATGAISGATATVKRALLRTGTWTSNGVGTLVFDSVSGTFQDDEDIKIATVTKVIANGADTAITLNPGGKFEFDNYNFTGASITQRMYFADGVNYIGEFDGTRLVPIRTGISDDKPKFIKGHRGHLFAAFGDRIEYSSLRDPYAWTALTGAAVIGLGETCTGMLPQISDVSAGIMVISTKTKTYLLHGNDSADFNLILHAPETGAYPYTMQNIGRAHFLDTKGVMQMFAAQEFGGFQMSTMSKSMQTYMDSKQGKAVASCVVRKKNQYRVFFNDGDGLIVYFGPGAKGMEVALMPFAYGDGTWYINQTCTFNDADGTERVMAAASNGYIYELDVGTSFDGDPISHHIMMTFVHSKSPGYVKTYKGAELQFRAGNTARVNIGYDLSYGNLDTSYGSSVSMSQAQAKSSNASGGYWDNFNWENIAWDSSFMQKIPVNVTGEGESVSLLVAGETDEDEPFVIHTCTIHYHLRRPNRI